MARRLVLSIFVVIFITATFAERKRQCEEMDSPCLSADNGVGHSEDGGHKFHKGGGVHLGGFASSYGGIHRGNYSGDYGGNHRGNVSDGYGGKHRGNYSGGDGDMLHGNVSDSYGGIHRGNYSDSYGRMHRGNFSGDQEGGRNERAKRAATKKHRRRGKFHRSGGVHRGGFAGAKQ